MKNEKRISIRLCNEYAVCNSCYAQNYESSTWFCIGEKVDKLSELHIGNTVITLCDECISELKNKISDYVD